MIVGLVVEAEGRSVVSAEHRLRLDDVHREIERVGVPVGIAVAENSSGLRTPPRSGGTGPRSRGRAARSRRTRRACRRARAGDHGRAVPTRAAAAPGLRRSAGPGRELSSAHAAEQHLARRPAHLPTLGRPEVPVGAARGLDRRWRRRRTGARAPRDTVGRLENGDEPGLRPLGAGKIETDGSGRRAGRGRSARSRSPSNRR